MRFSSLRKDHEYAKELIDHAPNYFRATNNLDGFLMRLRVAQEKLGDSSDYTRKNLDALCLALPQCEENELYMALAVLWRVKYWLKGRPQCIEIKALVLWLDGLIQINLGRRREGARLIERASSLFDKICAEKFFLASACDLAQVYLEDDRYDLIEDLFWVVNSRVVMLAREQNDRDLEDALFLLREAQRVFVPVLL